MASTKTQGKKEDPLAETKEKLEKMCIDEDKQISDNDQKRKDGSQKPENRRRRFNRKMMSEEELKKFIEDKEKNIVERNIKGSVKWYSVLGHYGFVEPEKGEDVFVHQTSIIKSKTRKYYLRTLGNGENVQFDIVETDKGREAINVTGPDGSDVIGSRFHLLQLPWFRRVFNERKRQLDEKRKSLTDGEVNEKEPKKRTRKSSSKISNAEKFKDQKDQPAKPKKQRNRKKRNSKNANSGEKAEDEETKPRRQSLGRSEKNEDANSDTKRNSKSTKSPLKEKAPDSRRRQALVHSENEDAGSETASSSEKENGINDAAAGDSVQTQTAN